MSTDKKWTIQIPENVKVSAENGVILVSGPKGELKRKYPVQILQIKIEEKTVTVTPKLKNSRARAIAGAFAAHIKNMVQGVQKEWVYKLKVCSSHFPIKVELSGNEIKVFNFLGEKSPRITRIDPQVKVQIKGDVIEVQSIDKELAGQTATRIEQLTRLRNKDRRVFQDGIYIIEKAGKKI